MARPLTKRDRDGNLYVRRPDIEAAIDAALGVGLEGAAHSAALPRGAEGYLSEEVLVHLVRTARERDDDRTFNALLPLLLARCGQHLRVRPSAGVDQVQLRKEILARFSALFAFVPGNQASQRLDYFEANFSGAFATLQIDAYRWERRRTAVAKPPAADAEAEPIDAQQTRAHDVQEPLRSAVVRQHVAAVDALPAEEREAWILVYRLGLKVESLDPSEATAARLLGVTGKTVRNRLARARTKLGVKEES